MRKWMDLIEQDERRQGGDRRSTERDDATERRVVDNIKKQQEASLLRDLQKRQDDRRHKDANAAAKEWDQMGKRAQEQKNKDNAAVGDWMDKFDKARTK